MRILQLIPAQDYFLVDENNTVKRIVVWALVEDKNNLRQSVVPMVLTHKTHELTMEEGNIIHYNNDW